MDPQETFSEICHDFQIIAGFPYSKIFFAQVKVTYES